MPRFFIRLSGSRLALCVLLFVTSFLAPAQAPARLLLDDSVAMIDLWPAVSVLHDPDGRLTIENILGSIAAFDAPHAAYAALGLRQKVVWLRVPVSVPTRSNGRWILDFDYSLLNRIDVHVATGGRVVKHAVLGDAQPNSQRPLPGRSHAVLLEFPPGNDYELLLRVETIGSMILPVTLSKLSAFHQRAIDEQMLQGVLSSLALCLLLYSLLKWISLREHLYLKYSLLALASALFSVHFFGIGAQYLWTDITWLERHMAGMTSLIAAVATALFIEDALGPDMNRLLRRAMRILAGVLAIAAAMYALDVIDIYAVGILMGTLALLPALLGLPGAIARVRRGDNVGAYFIFAWVGYFVASAIMVGVVKGHIDANFWTIHSFQIGATFDMLIFMRIAILRSAAVHIAAQRATREHETLHSLAHTDPLTGLLNRRGLNTTLAAALHNCNPAQVLAVYMLDLDGFKPINDQFGHDVGDELLAIVAQRLRSTMRTGDVVARVGGDEFVVMAGGLTSDQQAKDLGAKLLDAFREPFALEQENCRVGVTIGYVLAPADGHDAAGLLKAADAAMYAGKQSGKNRLRRGAVAG